MKRIIRKRKLTKAESKKYETIRRIIRQSELNTLMKQARHNFNRQKLREELGLPIKVASTFWLSVYFDYKRERDMLK